MPRFNLLTLTEMREFAIGFGRMDFTEYKWWEFELMLTFWKWHLTVRISSHV
jgi:hypothetical protein